VGAQRLVAQVVGHGPDTCNDGSSPPAASSISQGDTITVRLNRTYSPVLRHPDIPDVAVRWWGGRRLHFRVPLTKAGSNPLRENRR